jgi:phosphoribosylamine-glycine ligase
MRIGDPEERAIIMTNAELYERIKSEGREEDRVEAKARAVLSVLAARGNPVSEAQEETIVRCTDENRLDRWHLAAITASSDDDVLRG